MKKTLLVCCALALTVCAQAQWKPAGDKIKTKWAEQINPKNVLPEYPRPQLERTDWVNLNGEWEYAIKPKGEVEPQAFDGNILVPFAIESSLSGVQKEVGDANELWYKRTFSVPANWKNKDIVLNFGAVDWKADVFINDVLIGSHQGGFTPFSFNITPYLNGKSNQKLVVRVWDPSDKGYQPRGKQTSNPEGIWYTPVTGIWQTVWIEPVATNHITSVKSIPNIDNGTMNVTVGTSMPCNTSIVEVKLMDKGQVVASAKGIQGKELRLAVQNPTLWDTTNPYLYDMKVSLVKDGKVLDDVKSYTAFRKISAKRDANGVMRMQLNNKNLFHYGPLDQGWWPDGLYTAPTDEALLYDIIKTKEWGFNMIRKHVKVEPSRWYYHCDKEGILVWQDMPSGDMGNQWAPHTYNGGTDKERSSASIANYYQEWKEIMDLCVSHPSIVVWVPFNEAWGQFDTEKVAEWTKNYDPSRLVNPASGGNHRACGDILDLHNYPGPNMFLYDPQRVTVLGEYGGIGLPLENHLWWNKRNWGYVQFKNSDEVTAEYVKYANELKDMVDRGFSAAVYTQTTDVEGEVNGLMTYDRKEIKINEAAVKKANQAVINQLSK
ncbi:glycoside hydrolase family 2 protein [Parabacteroides faecis]|uniref:Beta-galactosidase/beta-glucuronidase n=1 Tax=Parabacteroides faecis TaxID=1217282 RepID=A0ABR6KNR7_9BACT|nr:sugar-binding domain-containing protein [Parabacteroides faecis]MBB4622484.1 beta-galactosidase/beta-glucuronidase [Parabacteroides faecis]MCS2892111.1 beta-galactosidase [Parabacteroides faecis]UVQ49246.1 beta-galactosidase [Parabacteroides faecis]GGK10262.1 beta-galactosidase [Parabacteroides faecis]